MNTGLKLPPAGVESLPILSIAEYDRRQASARAFASYPAIRSFAPASFVQVNFPTQVSQEAELRRYADIMYETLDRGPWLNERLWSPDEQDLILTLRREIEALTHKLFGRPVQALMCLFPPLEILRVVEAVAEHRGRRLRIVEVGPGAGYFGAYCLLRDHRYLGIDNTQALYLWQHRLFRWLTRGALDDLALADRTPPAFPSAPAALMPWWHFAEAFRAEQLKADLVICDAAMGEMDPFAARYLIHLASRMLGGSDVGLFLFQNLGEERLNTRAFIDSRFLAHGFRRLACGSVQVAATRSSPVDFLTRLAAGAPPIGQPRGGKGMLPAAKFLAVDHARLMESYAFFDFVRLDLG